MASLPTRRCVLAACLASALLAPVIAAAAGPGPGPVAPGTAGPVIVPDGTATSTAQGHGESLYLNVVVNGRDTGRIAHFIRTGDSFRATAEALRALGFRLPASEHGLLDVTALPGVAVHYDAATQQLEINAPPDLVQEHVAILNARANVIPHPTVSPGLLVNYDLYGARDNRATTNVSLYTELRAFNQWGVLSSTALSRSLKFPGAGTHTDSVRLDTTFSRSWVDRALTLRVGDVVSGALDWSRATRLGGIQLQRNFALQPDLVTFPVPAFYGQANLPSTVDLYVNGVKQYSSQVPTGPFQLNTVPVISGNGQAEVVITDALGRQRSIAFPFYVTGRLLKPGLSDFSLELGFVRRDYGLASFDYGSDPAFSGTWRRGFTDRLTLEGHGEATSGLVEGGVGAVIALGDAGGVLRTALAASHGHGASGRQAEVGYDWRNEHFNFSLDTRRSFGNYRDIASLYSLPPPRRVDHVLAGLMLGHTGSIGLSYVALQYPGEPSDRYASAYYYRSLGPRVALNFSVNQNLGAPRDRSLFLGISLSLDHGVSASLSAQHDNSGNLVAIDAGKPINPDGGVGWRLRAQDGNGRHGGMAQVGYNSSHGQILAGAQTFNGDTQGYADLSGALVLMDRRFFLARRIDNAFAVVSTSGVAGVPVLLENRPIGVTGSRGDLLVTQLNAYQRNKLSIDPMKLPVDVDIGRVNAEVVPTDRAGTLVKFGITPVNAASVILHDDEGRPVEVGSTATLRGSSAPPATIGFGGMVYLEHLQAHDVLDVKMPHGQCVARFDYHPQAGTVPVIGPLTCQETRP